MRGHAGNGANMALRDAYELADELVNGGHTTFQAAIDSYDIKNSERSKQAILGSHRMIEKIHSGGLMKYFYIAVFKIVGWLVALGAPGMQLWRSLRRFGFSQRPSGPPKAVDM